MFKSAALSQPLSNQLLPSLTNQLNRPITTVANANTSYPNLGFQPISNSLSSINDPNNLFPDFSGRFSRLFAIIVIGLASIISKTRHRKRFAQCFGTTQSGKEFEFVSRAQHHLAVRYPEWYNNCHLVTDVVLVIWLAKYNIFVL